MAFFKRRRRRAAVQWFPPLAANTGAENLDYGEFQAGAVGLIYASSADDPVTQTIPLTWDYPTEQIINEQATAPSLADWQGSAWRLRRCVGKLHLGTVDQTPPFSQGLAADILITAGLIVLKVDEETGEPTRGVDSNAYATDTTANNRDPWIWRRSWVLGTRLRLADSGIPANFPAALTPVMERSPFPATNSAYGSVHDGPHIDAKTNRRIADEERLFMVLTARLANFIGTNTVNSQVVYTFDYRLLGSVMKQTNKRNASR